MPTYVGQLLKYCLKRMKINNERSGCVGLCLEKPGLKLLVKFLLPPQGVDVINKL